MSNPWEWKNPNGRAGQRPPGWTREQWTELIAFGLVTLSVVLSVLAVLALRSSIRADSAAKRATTTARRVDSNAQRIESLERADTMLNRRAAYRLCERQNITRAVLHGWATAYLDRIKPSPRERERLERLAPIVECIENLRGQAAVLLQPVEQRRYVRFFLASGRAPVVRDGRVLFRAEPNLPQNPTP